MQHFVFYKKDNHLAFTKTRAGEIKLGEKLHFISNEKKWQDDLKKSTSKFVLIGIPESIGVKANLGVAGTETAWSAFLHAFLNVQSNQFMDGSEILLLGYFDFSNLQQKIKHKPLEYIREVVAEIDNYVSIAIQSIVTAGKIPIIIGGGHNNAYGNIKGTALGLYQTKKIKSPSIHVINIDAHTDLRSLEGRHSGNGFSYAIQDGFLSKYAMIGVQELYCTQSILDDVTKNKNLKIFFLEDILIREKITLSQATNHAINHIKNNYFGIEIDLDVMEKVLSSAITPSGFTVNQVRQILFQLSTNKKIAYLHLCEGMAVSESNQTASTIGKLISFLVSDFVKALS